MSTLFIIANVVAFTAVLTNLIEYGMSATRHSFKQKMDKIVTKYSKLVGNRLYMMKKWSTIRLNSAKKLIRKRKKRIREEGFKMKRIESLFDKSDDIDELKPHIRKDLPVLFSSGGDLIKSRHHTNKRKTRERGFKMSQIEKLFVENEDDEEKKEEDDEKPIDKKSKVVFVSPFSVNLNEIKLKALEKASENERHTFMRVFKVDGTILIGFIAIFSVSMHVSGSLSSNDPVDAISFVIQSISTVGYGNIIVNRHWHSKILCSIFLVMGTAILARVVGHCFHFTFYVSVQRRMARRLKEERRMHLSDFDENGDGYVDRYEWLKNMLIWREIVKRKEIDRIMGIYAEIVEGGGDGENENHVNLSKWAYPLGLGCFWPIGIGAIYLKTRANQARSRGRISDSIKFNDMSRGFIFVSIGGGVAFWTLFFISLFQKLSRILSN